MKVLCAIDGSTSSDAAVCLLGQLLSTERDDVVFYYAPPKVTVRGPLAPSSEVVQQAGEALVEKVFQHARAKLPTQLAERSKIVAGRQKPRMGILAAAKVHRPELITVGARGTSRFGLPHLGSVSRAVVHSADIPVLVARARQRTESEPLQILLCCDRSESSSVTGRFLSQLSVPENAVGRVIHVTESLFGEGIPEWLEEEARISESEPIAKVYVEQHDEELASWKQQIAALCDKLPQAFKSRPPVVLEGHPGDRIVKYAESEQIDLVVVGAHTTSALTRMLAGSTSEHLLAHAACSVLIVLHHEAP